MTAVLPVTILSLLVQAGSLTPPVQQAVTDALAVPGGRAIVRGYQASTPCPASEARLERPIDGSGRYAVRLSGPSCRGWAWVTVEVRAPVSVTTRAVGKGEPLEGALAVQEREVRRSRAPAPVPAGARAARALQAGQTIEASHLVAAGATVGGTVKVIVRMGTLSVTQSGRVVSCPGGRPCAVLPSGRHVSGDLVDGQLVVAAP